MARVSVAGPGINLEVAAFGVLLLVLEVAVVAAAAVAAAGNWASAARWIGFGWIPVRRKGRSFSGFVDLVFKTPNCIERDCMYDDDSSLQKAPKRIGYWKYLSRAWRAWTWSLNLGSDLDLGWMDWTLGPAHMQLKTWIPWDFADFVDFD